MHSLYLTDSSPVHGHDVSLYPFVSICYTFAPHKLPPIGSSSSWAFSGALRGSHGDNPAPMIVPGPLCHGTRYTSGQRRTMVEEALFHNVNEALQTEAHSELVHVQLRRVDFPTSFVNRKLVAAVQRLQNSAEGFRREGAMEREVTNTEAVIILNSAEEVEQKARAEAIIVTMRAENKAIVLAERARMEGLQLVTSTLGVQESKHLVSLDYIIKFMDGNPETQTYVDFKEVISTSV